MRRLSKAAKYGALFEQLSKEKADDRTGLEAEVDPRPATFMAVLSLRERACERLRSWQGPGQEGMGR